MTRIRKILPFLCLMLFLQGGKFVINSSTNAVYHNEKGMVYLEQGYYIPAIHEFQIAVMLLPDTAASATFYNNLGQAYFKIKKYNWAITCYERAVGLNPNFYEYFKNLVTAYKYNKQLNIKYVKYKHAYDADQSNSPALLMCGLIQKEIGNKTLAVKYLKEFKYLEPDLILTGAVNDIIYELTPQL